MLKFLQIGEGIYSLLSKLKQNTHIIIIIGFLINMQAAISLDDMQLHVACNVPILGKTKILTKYIRMGITIFKIFIWEGILLDIWSEITEKSKFPDISGISDIPPFNFRRCNMLL